MDNALFLVLQLSETTAKRNMIKTVSDQAIHIDLDAKARGIVAAEKYFIDLPESEKSSVLWCTSQLLLQGVDDY
jgi:hypothetical protein